jgi:hypothetical protein
VAPVAFSCGASPRRRTASYSRRSMESAEVIPHPRTLVGKAFWHGFYWPTALLDAAEMVKSCKACQFHAKQIHTPAQAL